MLRLSTRVNGCESAHCAAGSAPSPPRLLLLAHSRARGNRHPWLAEHRERRDGLEPGTRGPANGTRRFLHACKQHPPKTLVTETLSREPGFQIHDASLLARGCLRYYTGHAETKKVPFTAYRKATLHRCPLFLLTESGNPDWFSSQTHHLSELLQKKHSVRKTPGPKCVNADGNIT